MPKIPYPHQVDANKATFSYFAAKTGSPLIVAPVASGKTLIYCEFIRQANEQYPGTNFVVLSHVAELLTQGADELIEQWPEAYFTFYGDKLGPRSLRGDTIFASIQTIYKHALDIPHRVDIIILDEAHLLSPTEGTMYQRFIADMRRINPAVKLLGYTGTPFRAGQGYLHKGFNALFTDIAYNISMKRLMDDGFLCPIFTPAMDTRMDVTGVHMRQGDFVQGELERAVDKDVVTASCVKEIIAYGATRKKWLVFCAGVQHAEHVRDAFRVREVKCDMVTGKTSKSERALILSQFKDGNTRCLVNVATLTTGINIPAIDLIAFMRPTRSPVLYTQCVGRALRTHPGKTDAVCLDFGGVVAALGPVDELNISDPKKGGGEAVMKICPNCHEYLFSGLRICSFCSHEFPPPDINTSLTTSSSNAPILSSQTPQVWKEVKSWDLWPHNKVGAPTSLRVTYKTGVQEHSEWWCLEHTGFARDKAVRFWAQHNGALPPPVTVDEAIKRKKELTMPTEISVKRNGKYTEIVDRRL